MSYFEITNNNFEIQGSGGDRQTDLLPVIYPMGIPHSG